MILSVCAGSDLLIFSIVASRAPPLKLTERRYTNPAGSL